MKDIPQAFEMAEYMDRSESFAGHLKNIDWQRIRQAMLINAASPWKGVASVILGVKPSYVFAEGEIEDIGVMDFIPGRLRNDFILVEKRGNPRAPWYQDWLVDVRQARNVFKEYPKYFPDTVGQVLDKEYVANYIKGLQTAFDNQPEEQIKTGLILGYPLDSVLAFSYEHRRTEPFDHKGFELASVKTDTKPFIAWLDKIYRASGMDTVLEENEQRLSAEFAKHVASQKESIDYVRMGARKFLEIKFADPQNNLLGTQMVLLQSGRLTPDDIHHYLNIFSKRHGVPELRFLLPKGKKSGAMGVYYEGFVESILKAQTKKNIVYLTKKEYATKYEPGIETIDRKDLVEWLATNGRKNLVKLVV